MAAPGDSGRLRRRHAAPAPATARPDRCRRGAKNHRRANESRREAAAGGLRDREQRVPLGSRTTTARGLGEDPSYLTRSRYEPSVGSTLTLSPICTNGGTCTVTPVSSFAGLYEALAVAPFIDGSVSTTSKSTLDGGLMPIGLPS